MTVLAKGLQILSFLQIDGKLASEGNLSFLWKVLHLPMDFFSQRMAGDLQNRQDSAASISSVLIGTFAPLVFYSFLVIFYLVIMMRYSVVLSLVAIVCIAIQIVSSFFITREKVDLMRTQMRDDGNLASATVSGVEMIETIKASGAENGFFARWSGFQAAVSREEKNLVKVDAGIGLIPVIAYRLSLVLISVFGASLVISGQFTAGMVMAFQSYLLLFMNPALTLVEAGQTLQMMRAQMERIDDVMKYPSDPLSFDSPAPEGVECDKLTGTLDIEGVDFGYSPLEGPLIKDLSLHVKSGSRVAIVGPSGCGKSTVTKLLSGLYQPWKGSILFDGKAINEIPRAVFKGSLAVVDQDVILFEDTISANISMWDPSITDFEIIMASRDAHMHEDILQRDGGYQYRIQENGKDFSGGQRQRLEIARVLAQDPTIIIMDEATSALDAQTEFDVVNAIHERGITTIIVAHRLSTIRDCDEIIVMDKGVVVERGRHEELYRRDGYYTRLVQEN